MQTTYFPEPEHLPHAFNYFNISINCQVPVIYYILDVKMPPKASMVCFRGSNLNNDNATSKIVQKLKEVKKIQVIVSRVSFVMYLFYFIYYFKWISGNTFEVIYCCGY